MKKEYRFYLRFIDGTPDGIKTTDMSKDRVQSSPDYMPTEEAYRKCAEINNLLVQFDELLTHKLNSKQKMEKGMSDFETLEGKINYYFHIENLKLYEIAYKLGYSYEWIRHVKSRYDKTQRQHNFDEKT